MARERSEIEVKAKRDWKGEKERSQLSFFSALADVNEQRTQGKLSDIWQVAQALIICGLPYDEPHTPHWERTARLGDGSIMTVTFSSTKAGVSLPFGQDRGPLYYLINKAIATYRQLDATLPRDMDPAARAAKLDSARFVEWEAATEYLTKMGKGSSGKDYKILVDRMKRIRSCAISVIRTSQTGEESKILPIVRTSRLPIWALDPGQKQRRGEAVKEAKQQLSTEAGSNIRSFTASAEKERYGFEMAPDFFSDFVQHHVPVPLEIIRVLLRRPRHLDLFTFLCWRGFAARSTSLIPMSELLRQIGSTDSNSSRLAAQVQEVIDITRNLGWKELNAEMTFDGSGRRVLKIGPPANNIHFLRPSSDSN
jgi:hypothetical protein